MERGLHDIGVTVFCNHEISVYHIICAGKRAPAEAGRKPGIRVESILIAYMVFSLLL
jgi:hypothetical protein